MDERGIHGEQKTQLMNHREAATYLGVTPNTLRKWRGSDGLPCVQNGSTVRYDPSELDTWLRVHAVNADPQETQS